MIQPSPKHSPIAIFIVIVVGVLAFAQLITVSASVAPEQASKPELWLFFISMFFGLTTVFASLWHLLRRTLLRMRMRNVSFFVSYRQAALVAGVITFSFFLNSLHVFQLFDLIPLVLAVVLLEFFFQAEKTPHASIRHDPSNP